MTVITHMVCFKQEKLLLLKKVIHFKVLNEPRIGIIVNGLSLALFDLYCVFARRLFELVKDNKWVCFAKSPHVGQIF